MACASHTHLFPSSFNPRKISHCNSRGRSFLVVKAQSETQQKPVSENRMLVFVPPHPLIKHWVSVLRNEQTPCPIFIAVYSTLAWLTSLERRIGRTE